MWVHGGRIRSMDEEMTWEELLRWSEEYYEEERRKEYEEELRKEEESKKEEGV